jgi:hypothetical protein
VLYTAHLTASTGKQLPCCPLGTHGCVLHQIHTERQQKKPNEPLREQQAPPHVNANPERLRSFCLPILQGIAAACTPNTWHASPYMHSDGFARRTMLHQASSSHSYCLARSYCVAGEHINLVKATAPYQFPTQKGGDAAGRPAHSFEAPAAKAMRPLNGVWWDHAQHAAACNGSVPMCQQTCSACMHSVPGLTLTSLSFTLHTPLHDSCCRYRVHTTTPLHPTLLQLTHTTTQAGPFAHECRS